MTKFSLAAVLPPASCPKIVVESAELRARLAGLSRDLSRPLIFEAILAGLSARNDTTDASAPTAKGVQQWCKTVETLRTLLAAAGWTIHDERNCPFITSPDRSVSLVVMTGDEETGRDGFCDPTNQADKGSVARNFTESNLQRELFNQRDYIGQVKARQKETQVWALLYHYDKKSDEVRFELSLPTGFNGKRITAWGERLILGSIPNSPKDFSIRDDAPTSPFSVDVEPKAGNF